MFDTFERMHKFPGSGPPLAKRRQFSGNPLRGSGGPPLEVLSQTYQRLELETLMSSSPRFRTISTKTETTRPTSTSRSTKNRGRYHSSLGSHHPKTGLSPSRHRGDFPTGLPKNKSFGSPERDLLSKTRWQGFKAMKREKAVTFKGNPITLVGPELKVGDKAPDFKVLSGLDPKPG